MKAIREFEIRGRPGLSCVFETWIDTYAQAAREFRQERDRWYLEATLVALLSASAWRCGRPSIVEARSRRSSRNYARADLLIRAGRYTHAFEAKVVYVPFESNSGRIASALAAAKKDVDRLRDPRPDVRWALAFAVLEQQEPETKLPDVLEALLDHARRAEPRPDVIAAWLAHPTPAGVAFPGCLLVAART
jgi:hypothetical protein